MSIGLPISTYLPTIQHLFSRISTTARLQCDGHPTSRDGPKQGPKGAWAHFVPFFFFFFFTNYIHNFCSCSRSKTLGSFQLTAIQPKNLTKIIKTFTMVIVFQPKKKKLFYPKEPKNHVLLEKLKLNFFQLQSIDIYFVKIIFLLSIKKLKISLLFFF